MTEQCPTLKTSWKFKYLQIPGLKINGKMYFQSKSMLRYLGKKYNLMGKTFEEEYEINNILVSTEDLSNSLVKYSFPDNDKIINTYKKALIEKVLQYLDENYEKYGKNKYLFGDHLTLADILITILVKQLHGKTSHLNFCQ